MIKLIDEHRALVGIGHSEKLEDSVVKFAPIGLRQFIGNSNGSLGKFKGTGIRMAFFEASFYQTTNVAIAHRFQCLRHPLGDILGDITRIGHINQINVNNLCLKIPLRLPSVPAVKSFE